MAGSVFSAFSQCPGGQDGACKHIAVSLYLFHDCVHPSTGPTDDLCYWKKGTRRSKRSPPITEVKIGSNSMKNVDLKAMKEREM